MFNKLKEKLKNWFKSSEEKAVEKKAIEETIAKIEEKPKIKQERKKSIKEKKEIEVPLKVNYPFIAPDKEYLEKEVEKIKEEKPEKKSFFSKIKEKFKFKITEEYFEEIFSNLELTLLENNVSLEVVDKIKIDLKKELIETTIEKSKLEQEIKKALRISIDSLFIETPDLIKQIKKSEKPFVILFFGINGSGKTTTIAKIAYLLEKNNLSCVLAASDTFRAASIEQLQYHADKLKIKLIKSSYGSDPASVGYDAISHAKSHKIDVVLIDTAGRMHTKSDLMREMEKITRVTKPNLKIFIAESITGNDATEQAKIFNESIGIDGIILSKADVDEKSGTILSVSYITSKPILYLGTGQNYENLEKFDKNKLIKQLGL